MWFAGQQVPGDAVLWWMSVRWWSRAGQLAAFLGGATVVLDLIGPERLRELGRGSRKFHNSMGEPAPLRWILGNLAVSGLAAYLIIVTAVNLGLAEAVVAAASWLVANAVFIYGGTVVAKILDSPRPAQALRYVGVALLLVGFHFSLLSS